MDKIDRVLILDEYLKALEDERRKIEAFKRELPHCMQLLEYAIDASKENLVNSARSSTSGHPIASFIGNTIKTLGQFGTEMVQECLKSRWEAIRKSEDSEETDEEKARRSSSSVEGGPVTWMAEAQLWSQPSLRYEHVKEKESSTEDSVRWKKDPAEKSTLSSPAFLFNPKQRTGGAFMPFVKEKPVPSPVVRSKAGAAVDVMLSSAESIPTTITLSLGAGESEVGSVDVNRTRDVNTAISNEKETVGRLHGGEDTYSGATGSTTSAGGSQRKARRCWSPELHRRFVNVLQQLGGSQIATPKQIRELMKVDGLTNDEVKSHLQKYRLHTRRLSPTPQGSQQQTPPQLVVLGGIWVPPEYGSTACVYHDPSSSVSQPEPIYHQPSISKEFYSKLQTSAQIELHESPSPSSPQGPLQSTSNLSSDARQTSGEVNRDDSTRENGKSESNDSLRENGKSESGDSPRRSGKVENDDSVRENGKSGSDDSRREKGKSESEEQ